MQNFAQDMLKDLKTASTPEGIYQKIIELGKTSPLCQSWNFTPSDQVLGCQSQLYVKLSLENGCCHFNFYSDALISRGLAAILIHFYEGMTAKEVLTTPPTFLKELNLGHLLTPGRSNGINSLYKKILELVLTSCKSG